MELEELRAILHERLGPLRQPGPVAATKRKSVEYLNKEDKKKLGIVAAMTVALDEFIMDWEERGYPTQLLANAKRSRTFLYGTMNQLVKDIPYDERKKVIRAIGNYRITADERG